MLRPSGKIPANERLEKELRVSSPRSTMTKWCTVSAAFFHPFPFFKNIALFALLHLAYWTRADF